MRIGVLALQGDFAEHAAKLKALGVGTSEVRLPGHLEDIDGLIIPGGESTTIGKLADHYSLIEPLREYGRSRPVWGTCAGAILLSMDAHRSQPLLHLMNITVARNAFGPQIASFESGVYVAALSLVSRDFSPFPGVFIRAPLIESVQGEARALATLADGRIVAAQEGHLLATSFHPELTADDRFHRYFAAMVAAAIGWSRVHPFLEAQTPRRLSRTIMQRAGLSRDIAVLTGVIAPAETDISSPESA